MPQTALPNIGVQFEFTLGTNDWKNGFDSSMVILDSQVQAIGFYETLGFAARGGTFMDAGIPHRHMVLSLIAE